MLTHQIYSTFRSRRFRRMVALALAISLMGITALSSGGTRADVYAQSREASPSGSDSNPAQGQEKPRSGGDNGRSSGGGGVFFGIDLSCLFRNCDRDKAASTAAEDAASLARSGPKFPAKYAMSTFEMRGLVKGGAPFILDYNARQARVRIEIKVQDSKPFVFNLEANGHAQKIFRLPESFGSDPQVAVISVSSMQDRPGENIPAPLEIYGMGMGEKAVGSVAIDQLKFGPPEVRIGRFGKVHYSFHSRSDFNRVVAEFAQVENRNNVIKVARVNTEDLGEIAKNTWVGRDTPRIWNGKGEDGEVSQGLHLLKIRAWRSSVKEGDWVVSWSPESVNIKW